MSYNIRHATGSVQPFYQFLTDDGLPLGGDEMIGDYSVTPQAFYVQAQPGQDIRIDQLVVHVRISGNINAGKYNGMDELINGIPVLVGSNALTIVSQSLIPNSPVKSIGDWAKFGAVVLPTEFGQGDNFVTIEYKLPAPFILRGRDDEAFGVILNDDFSALTSHTVFVSGWTNIP